MVETQSHPPLFIITGDRGAGKTTFCRRFSELAQAAGWQTGGILSPAIFEAGQKTGIEAVDLRTGRRRLLAVQRQADSPLSPLQTKQWSFEAEVMAWGNEILQTALPCDLLIVDELGPLEFERDAGWQAGLAALDSGHYRWAMVVIRPELLALARQRWPTGQIIQITPAIEVETAARELAVRLIGKRAGEAFLQLGVDKPDRAQGIN
jgi:nucleoside-triphosphatase